MVSDYEGGKRMGYYHNNVGGYYGGYDCGNGFALLVVLFILLIIVGTKFKNWC